MSLQTLMTLAVECIPSVSFMSGGFLIENVSRKYHLWLGAFCHIGVFPKRTGNSVKSASSRNLINHLGMNCGHLKILPVTFVLLALWWHLGNLHKKF